MTIKPDSQTKVRTKEEHSNITIDPVGPAIVKFYPKNVDTQTNSNLFRNSSLKRVGRNIRNR